MVFTICIVQQKQLTPAQVVLLLRGIYQGESSAQLARELGLSRPTVHCIRHAIEANAQAMQPTFPVVDQQIETDERFQNAGKKSEPHPNPLAPPRRRANKRRGRGTYAKDRPPIVGTVGRKTGQVRLRVVHQTNKETLVSHVHQFTQSAAIVYTDEWRGYSGLNRCHATAQASTVGTRCRCGWDSRSPHQHH